MIYFISINLLSLFLCKLDKIKSIHHQWRIPEKVLLTLSLLGGCFGMMIGMHLFHHKTKKKKFYLVYLFSIVWIVILVSICYN